jgi:hypothetical protein
VVYAWAGEKSDCATSGGRGFVGNPLYKKGDRIRSDVRERLGGLLVQRPSCPVGLAVALDPVGQGASGIRWLAIPSQQKSGCESQANSATGGEPFPPRSHAGSLAVALSTLNYELSTSAK